MHDGCPTGCVGDAAFGYEYAFTKHMNGGFLFGTLLTTPAGMPEGTGTFRRHVEGSRLQRCEPAVVEVPAASSV